MTNHAPVIWPHPACLTDEQLWAQCHVGRGRSGGPGGQNRNKVETLIELTHTPTGVEAHAGERRTQSENKRVALRRLRLALAVQVRMPVPLGEIGSALWKSRRKNGPQGANAATAGGSGVLEINPDHHDFPMLLAEAMDVIAASGWDPKRASLRLNVSATQLVRLVKEHAPAILHWNRCREELGDHLLR